MLSGYSTLLDGITGIVVLRIRTGTGFRYVIKTMDVLPISAHERQLVANVVVPSGVSMAQQCNRLLMEQNVLARSVLAAEAALDKLTDRVANSDTKSDDYELLTQEVCTAIVTYDNAKTKLRMHASIDLSQLARLNSQSIDARVTGYVIDKIKQTN